MVRIRTPPAFAIGARVANPLEGRTGRIESFDADSELYTLVYHDGHRERLNGIETARLVVNPAQQPSDAPSTADSERDDDPDNLLGAAVTRTETSYDGERLVVSGYVLEYLANKREYRVSFVDGTIAEWSRDRTRTSVAASSGVSPAAAAAAAATSQPKKRKRADGGDSNDSDSDANKGPDLRQTPFPSRSTAYAVIRKVLCVILAQSTIKKTRTEKQVTVLNNEDLKHKRALENFVDASGLVCLQRVLVIWMRKPATHEGALLILKVLACLPGVTPDAVLQSGIGKTLRGIASASRSMQHVPQVLGDLAEWIIRSWKRSVLRKSSLVLSAKELIQENSSELRAVDTLPLYVPPPPPSTDRQAMTEHLRRLLRGEVDAPRTSSAAAAAAANANDLDRDAVYLPRFNSLGSEDARRPARQTKLLDTLAAKINRDHVEGLKKQQQQQQQANRRDGGSSADGPGAGTDDDGSSGQTTGGGSASIWDEDNSDSVSIGRLVFGRPQIQLFQRDGVVAHLRSTTRTRLLARQSVVARSESSLVLDDEVPSAELPRANKLLAPAKSILKTTASPVVPAAQVRW